VNIFNTEPFRARTSSKFAKSAHLKYKKKFPKNYGNFDADSESDEKVEK
jgi:hypothetical protein